MPSNVILEKKQQVVAELSAQIKESVSGVLVNYQGITVDADTAMRKELREAGVDYKVVKNSLTGRACEEAGYGDMKQYLSGMTAIAISKDDAVAPAKILKKYADKVKSFLSVELSMGQMIEDVKLATECKKPVYLCNRVGGMIPTPEQVLESIKKMAGGER